MDAVILIPTLNRPTDLRRTLDHILPLLDERLGLILVDDASTDPAHRRLLQEARMRPHVEVVRLDVRHGCTRARKVVLATLDVPVVIMLDDDSFFIDAIRDDIRDIVDRFEVEPRLAAQAFPCYVPSRDASVEAVHSRIYNGRMVSGFINCACAVRMEAYRDIGGYRDEFASPYGEERDLCLRFMDRGWTIRQFLGPTVKHLQSITARDKLHNVRGNALNYLLFIWWYHPAWLAAPYSVTTVVKLLLHGLRKRQPMRGHILGIVDFGREVVRGLPRRPVRPETLKLFYSLKHRRVMTDEEAEEVRAHPWRQVLYEQVIHPHPDSDDARSPRWWLEGLGLTSTEKVAQD